MSKEQELKEMLKLYSKQDLWNRIQEKQAMIYDLLYNQNQKAIEQLEKVKEIVKHFCEIHSDDYYGVKSQVMGIRQDVFEFIDQQIKQLRSE